MAALKNKWKSKQFLYEEASNFHNQLRDILLNGSFKSIKAYQEVPLEDLTNGQGKGLRVDWYIESFNLVIELQGRQHYHQTNFGHSSKVTNNLDFIAIKARDSTKKALLLEADYLFLEIPYTDQPIMNEAYLVKRIEEIINDRKS